MASNDAEAQSITNERTALLSDQDSPPPHSAQNADEDDVSPPEEKQPRGWGWYVWRGLWFAITVLFLALFIKGWVDAGSDTDVCASPLS